MTAGARRGATAGLMLWVLVLVAPAAPAQEACTAEAMTSWLELRRESLGVRGTDPHPILAPEVVPNRDQPLEQSCPTEVDFALDQEGRAVDGIHSWVFAHPCKLTVCGSPQSFEENRRLFWISGEYDLNNNIEFDDDFEQNRLNRHLCIAPSRGDEAAAPGPFLALQEPRLCFPRTKTLHVEITPPAGLRPLMRRLWLEDPPNGWYRWRRSLYDQQTCVYGPFVADTAHAAQAEIHPAQLYWWNERLDSPGGRRDPFGADGPFALFLIQDGSNRYTQPHHFVLGTAPPDGSDWRPWAYGPLEAVYHVAFWSARSDPPRFELTPYEYGGETSPSPIPESCESDRVQELTAGDGIVYARVCNGTGRRRGTGVDVESQWLCECDPGKRPRGWTGEWCPEPGFLGKLTLRMNAGGAREWREGFLAVRLTDSRSPGRRLAGATLTALDRSKPETEKPTEQLTWRPGPDPPWEQVAPAPDPTAAEARPRLFREAGWPEEVDYPETSLWRLRSVDLSADVAVPGLRDSDRKKKEVTADFREAEATSLSSSASRPLSFDQVKQRQARLSLAELPPTEAFRIEAFVEMTVRHPEISTEPVVSQAGQREIRTDEARRARWLLWSHGLGAQPAAEWHRAARALCDCYRRDPPCPAPPSLAGVREEPPPPAATSTLDVDLRTVVDRILKDDVVSTTQLTLLVRDVHRLCQSGVELQPAARPTPVQAKR
ncbi:MAG: hypothetical protein LJF30_11995 [Acidobacteria bacterium]|nr:hypothetical protein [Acidobacteriota bacterium]